MGDLQRMLSAYFSVPITVKRIHVSETPNPRHSPTIDGPITQHRKVHLLSAPKSLRTDKLVNGSSPKPTAHERVLCIATSCVRITSEIAAQKFLDEKYAIGQVFRILGRVADFTLLEVSTDLGNEEVGRPGTEYLRRRYLLKTEGFECEIDEVFPDREMFSSVPEDWLAAPDPVTEL
ncbi:hypothetical protein CPB86DRAFT_692667 [Serendipita vermifera]|nr:hypothetical protein CPB86DRAFT_692667 [Serendipita vermifera]